MGHDESRDRIFSTPPRGDQVQRLADPSELHGEPPERTGDLGGHGDWGNQGLWGSQANRQSHDHGRGWEWDWSRP